MTRSSVRRSEWRAEKAQLDREKRKGKSGLVDKARPFGRVIRVKTHPRGFELVHPTRGRRVVSRLPYELVPAVMKRTVS